MATVCQIDDPVNPITVRTPNAAAARAVSAISAAARCRTPSGDPSPQIRAGRIAWCRSSIGWSQTAWPTRWQEIAQHFRPYFVEQRVPPGQVAVLAQRPVDLEVVAPAGELKPVVPPRAREPADLLKRQVRPLPGEEGEWPCHQSSKIYSNGPATLRLPRCPPAAGRRAALHRVKHPLHRQPVAERRLRLRAVRDRRQQVPGLVGERVLPAEGVPGRPPAGQVGMAAAR